jgi:putative endonuclease
MADRYRGTMYVGVTSFIAARAFQHRSATDAEFCRQHNLTRLVWAEWSESLLDCIAHEKRLKRWRREWKFELIERGNPNWKDLFDRLT